ncbi:hypothetical protein [Mucilaginibacter xinganensis]|uniref:Exo-alpha-sialidase n=1 Tax=Mucilaginibacter xinganensis TaxID=1234841 RepID=A0A223NWH5_9SPHI|nr:hypothetical protein [Mucilaginibacter xinganensis]ASU34130.1 hypothetical protein MuYL_2240 [Mucilaginibacter xinganensis]
MKLLFLSIVSLITIFAVTSWVIPADDSVTAGQQPQVTSDSKGVIRVVFGRQDEIFCVTSNDNGVTFSKPVLVAKVADMHLGMSRGPQIASSANFSIITAMDKAGNIHWFRLDHKSNKWKDAGTLNDLNKSAPEGLMSITADNKDNFYATWLDTRSGGNNQIYFSSISAKGVNWSKNIMAYRSPDGHVCECCKPNIAVKGAHVVIMFRNWINGSRDLYLTASANNGKSFTPAEKLGLDSWKLNGCPMDGGGVIIGNSNSVQTTWQRKGIIYYAEPGKPEVYIGKGRTCSISESNTGSAFIALQNNDTVKLVAVKNKTVTVIGSGGFLRAVSLPGNKTLCVWEQNNQVKFKRI